MMFNKKPKTETNKDNNSIQPNQSNNNFNSSQLPSERNKISEHIKDEVPSIIKSNSDLNLFDMDTKIEIENFIMSLKGYSFEPESSMWVRDKNSKPLIHEDAINKIKNQLDTIANKHSINTNITIDEMHEICKNNNNEIIFWLSARKRKYNMALSDLSSIVVAVDNLQTIVLSRAVGGENRKLMTERTRITGSSNNGGSYPN